MAIQVRNGKAFEYALLIELYDKLKTLTAVVIVENDPFLTAKSFYGDCAVKNQQGFSITASAAINFLIDIEPRLKFGISPLDVLQLEIVSDGAGQNGDVRDVLIIRSSQNWEIGISAKNNHRAVKHPRLSERLDFGKKWMGLGCSDKYFANILPIFNFLKETKESDPSTLWSSLDYKEDNVYVPILNAFKKELIRLVETDSEVVPKNLVEFLVGNKDFYKIIRADDKVEIQGYNLHGTLNLPFQNQKPKAKISKLDFPTRLVEIVFLEDSKTTLMAYFNKGWTISFRLHNASSRVEPSLKFDINLVSAPYSLFTTQILI